jgi:hypothetical protein
VWLQGEFIGTFVPKKVKGPSGNFQAKNGFVRPVSGNEHKISVTSKPDIRALRATWGDRGQANRSNWENLKAGRRNCFVIIYRVLDESPETARDQFGDQEALRTGGQVTFVDELNPPVTRVEPPQQIGQLILYRRIDPSQLRDELVTHRLRLVVSQTAAMVFFLCPDFL